MEEKSKRLLSIDALRGFDMFFISGGAAFIHIIHGKTDWAWVDLISEQMEHPSWNGFTFYDFIMPLFLFISGVSLSFSLSNGIKRNISKSYLYKKAFKRMIILMILGIVYKNAPVPIFDPSDIRFSSVLGRIGMATFVTTLLYLNFNIRQRFYWVMGILFTFYGALYLVPVPGFGAGNLSFEGNLVGWIDRLIMPGKLSQSTFDQLGISTQLPSLCLTILGAWAGDILREQRNNENRKFQNLLLFGSLLIIGGLVWGVHFPINKHLWTSSFILLTSGMSFLILALFYWTIDVLGFRKWAFFFKVIGMNSLTIYFAYSFINFSYTSNKLFSGFLSPIDEKWHEFILSFGTAGLVWVFLYILYKNKLFIKI